MANGQWSIKSMPNTKLEKLIQKGDKAANKGKHKKALKHYRKAQELDPEHIPVYDRLIETHKKIEREWTDEDFALSLAWTMQKQELEDPRLKLIHAKLEPEWKEVSTLIQKMLSAEDEESETAAIEQISSYGNDALYPLIDALLMFKEIGRKVKKNL